MDSMVPTHGSAQKRSKESKERGDTDCENISKSVALL